MFKEPSKEEITEEFRKVLDREKAEIIYGKFIIDHTKWIHEWIAKNTPEGSGVTSVVGICNGLGFVAGVFCSTMTFPGVSAKALRSIIVQHINEEVLGETKYEEEEEEEEEE